MRTATTILTLIALGSFAGSASAQTDSTEAPKKQLTVVEQATAGNLQVNPNTATAAQLDSLPGVGPKTAESILAYKAEAIANGDSVAFVTVEDMLAVKGIGPVKLEAMRPFLALPDASIVK